MYHQEPSRCLRCGTAVCWGLPQCDRRVDGLPSSMLHANVLSAHMGYPALHHPIVCVMCGAAAASTLNARCWSLVGTHILPVRARAGRSARLVNHRAERQLQPSLSLQGPARSSGPDSELRLDCHKQWAQQRGACLGHAAAAGHAASRSCKLAWRPLAGPGPARQLSGGPGRGPWRQLQPAARRSAGAPRQPETARAGAG
jgi:hypothetical protein